MVKSEILREVMLENREEVMRHEVIKRRISLDGFDRQVLVGARRAGKSYILYGKIQELIAAGYTWNEIVYINFEDERLAGMTVDDLNMILEVHSGLSEKRPMLFLDEIQNVDGWERFARRIADNKFTVFITGSNAKMLSTDVNAALGGRYMTREVFPMQFDEYLKANGKNPADKLLTATTAARGEFMGLFEEYFQFGGFPECATLPVKRDYLMSLYQKIFLGDIAARHRIENVFALRILFRKLAESVKQPLSFTRATNIVASTGTKIGKSTVINYLGYASEAYLILPVTNIADSLEDKVSNPKYYFIDNGIISLLALDIRTSLLENMVALKLISSYGCYAMNDAEGSFERETRALLKLRSRLSCRRNIIVTYDDEGIIETEGVRIEVIPAWKFLLQP